jgi:hypothetical protein
VPKDEKSIRATNIVNKAIKLGTARCAVRSKPVTYLQLQKATKPTTPCGCSKSSKLVDFNKYANQLMLNYRNTPNMPKKSSPRFGGFIKNYVQKKHTALHPNDPKLNNQSLYITQAIKKLQGHLNRINSINTNGGASSTWSAPPSTKKGVNAVKFVRKKGTVAKMFATKKKATKKAAKKV